MADVKSVISCGEQLPPPASASPSASASPPSSDIKKPRTNPISSSFSSSDKDNITEENVVQLQRKKTPTPTAEVETKSQKSPSQSPQPQPQPPRSPDSVRNSNRSPISDISPSTSATKAKHPVIMPSNSFLLSTLLNLKPGQSPSPSQSPSPGLDTKEHHTQSQPAKNVNRMKSKARDDEETTDDDGVKITYEQILSRPPRKRLCYSMPQYKPTKSGSGSSVGSAGTAGSTAGSDEDEKEHATTKTNSNSRALELERELTREKPGGSGSGSSSPVLPGPTVKATPTASCSPTPAKPTPVISAKDLQFPIAVRTDEFRRRSSRTNHHRPGGPPIPRPRVERYIVASRDIEPGEIILQENPLIAGPISRKSKTLDKSKYCLGCYQNVSGLYKCSKCGWPMCNAKCEKIPDHAEFECEVFASNPVSPIVHSSEYEKIKVLRCLLLRDKYPERWNKLLELDAHNELRQGNFVAVSQTINIFKFIKQECHLNQFDGETVNHIVGVCAVNGFPTDGLLTPSSNIGGGVSPRAHQHQHRGGGGVGSGAERGGSISSPPSHYVPTNASLLFFNASLITQDCVPNSYTIISKSPAPNSSSYLLSVIASQGIKKGQIITHAFVDSTRGTFQRRQQLKELYYFSCDCRRCSDPSELCTHYSSLKCPKGNCQNGYLYPLNSSTLELTGQWYCNYAPRCDFRITNAQVVELLKHVQYDISKTYVQHSLFQEYENLEAVLDKYKGKVLHPNHFLIMDIQYSIISCINKLLVLVNEEEALKLATKQIEYCRDCLEMADILHPGSNRIRGNLLFYLHEGMLIIFLGEFKRNINQESFLKVGKNKFEEIIKIMNESKAILINEPEGSLEYQKIKALTMDSANLQPLLEYFGITL